MLATRQLSQIWLYTLSTANGAVSTLETYGGGLTSFLAWLQSEKLRLN